MWPLAGCNQIPNTVTPQTDFATSLTKTKTFVKLIHDAAISPFKFKHVFATFHKPATTIHCSVMDTLKQAETTTYGADRSAVFYMPCASLLAYHTTKFDAI